MCVRLKELNFVQMCFGMIKITLTLASIFHVKGHKLIHFIGLGFSTFKLSCWLVVTFSS